MENADLLNIIREREKDGEVVIQTIEGLMAINIEDLLRQPIEGILYDLNRDTVTCATHIKNGVEGWINNYATALVLIHVIDELMRYRNQYFVCPDCGYKVNSFEFLHHEEKE